MSGYWQSQAVAQHIWDAAGYCSVHRKPCHATARPAPEPVHPDWYDAQVIQATTKHGRRVLLCDTCGWFVWGVSGRREWYSSLNISDVRIIVDADGNVAPPPITDEMVDAGYHASRGLPKTRKAFRAALTAALNIEAA